MPNAIEVLMKAHVAAKRLFEEVLASRGPDREAKWKKLAIALHVHVALEKDIFYPKITTILERAGKQLPDEAILDQETEESEAPMTIDKIGAMRGTDPKFEKSVREFQAIVLEHAGVEETQVFPMVRADVKAEKLEEIGREMEKRKRELTQQVETRLRTS